MSKTRAILLALLAVAAVSTAMATGARADIRQETVTVVKR